MSTAAGAAGGAAGRTATAPSPNIALRRLEEEERVRRWGEKGGDPEDARRRISAQIREEAARERVHDVIWNGGSREDLRRKVAELYRRWTE